MSLFHSVTRVVRRILKTDRGFAAAVTSTLLSQAATLVLALCLDVLIARRLGPAMRGVYALATLVVTLCVQALDLGFSTATTYFVARKPRRTGAILGNDAAIVLAASLTMCAAAILMPYGVTLSPAALCAGVLLAATTLAYNFTSAVLFGQQSVASANRMPVLYIAGLLLGAGLGHMNVAGLLAAASIGRVVALAYGLRGIRWPARLTVSGPVLAASWRFVVREYASNLTTLAAYRADQFIVAGLAGTADLGLYVVAASITERLNLLPGAIASVLMPKVASSGGDGLQDTRRILRGVMCCSAGLAGVVAIACPLAMRVLYGPAYAHAVPAILLLLPGSLGMAAAKLASSHLLGRGRAGSVLAASVIAAVVTMLLDLVLIPGMGIAGAAAASSIGYCTAAAFQLAQLRPREPRAGVALEAA
jgi:O-antigen/teichoic acid export membrane protein